jgi:hypothetical protein
MLNPDACRRGLAIAMLWLSLPLLSACDNTPNPKFQQELQARESGAEGDSYALLGKAPRIRDMTWWKPEDHQARANVAAQEFARTYESMLEQLDAEKVADSAQALFAPCRTAFAQTLEYQKQATVEASAGNPTLDPAMVFSDLHRCRENALQAGKTADKQVEFLSTVLRRFSSTGMVLIGVSMMGKGEEQAGLKLWKGGDGLLDKDAAGFKLSLKAFRGY